MKKVIVSFLVLFLAACQRQVPPLSQGLSANTFLTGRITEVPMGQPVEGAFVYVYKESNTHFFGPPNYLSAASDQNGRYALEIPPGKYYVFARKRQSGSYQGPLIKDDFSGEPGAGRGAETFGPGKTTVDLMLQKLEGQQFYRPEKFGAKTTTVIAGRILDQAGRPVFGAMAFAYRDKFLKGQPPDYGSVASDQGGRYFLYLDQGGKFVVGARMKPKEPPEKGELLGFYRDNRESTLEVPTGKEVGQIDIVISPFAGAPEMKKTFIPFQY
jgi:hypothetical protein